MEINTSDETIDVPICMYPDQTPLSERRGWKQQDGLIELSVGSLALLRDPAGRRLTVTGFAAAF